MLSDELERIIAEKADNDGQYAIAYALLQVAYELKHLGIRDAATAQVGEKRDNLTTKEEHSVDL